MFTLAYFFIYNYFVVYSIAIQIFINIESLYFLFEYQIKFNMIAFNAQVKGRKYQY